MTKIRVITHPNIALIKYWGKRDTSLMLPTKNSLGITLAALKTTTYIEPSPSNSDLIELNGKVLINKNNPITSFLDTVRNSLGINKRFSISSKNNFPTASGLASSASGFAALAFGINSVCNLKLSLQEISILARLGSGSAARSVHGGFVLWEQGKHPTGIDCYASQIFNGDWWPDLRVMIAITTNDAKKTPSRAGMQQSIKTSPYYSQWLVESESRLHTMITAIQQRNISLLGKLAEQDWCGMRQVMLSSKPVLDYWSDTSNRLIKKIISIREKNAIEAYITTDAGPHVKIIHHAQDTSFLMKELSRDAGVVTLVASHLADNPIVEEK